MMFHWLSLCSSRQNWECEWQIELDMYPSNDEKDKLFFSFKFLLKFLMFRVLQCTVWSKGPQDTKRIWDFDGGFGKVLGGHVRMGHMHMSRMEKKLVGNVWWMRGLDQNCYLGFLWVNKKRSKWSCGNYKVAMLMRTNHFMHAERKWATCSRNYALELP